MRRIRDWFKALFELVEAHQKKQPWRVVIEWPDGHYEDLYMRHLAMEFSLPEVVACVVKDGDMPTEQRFQRFRAVWAMNGVALYKLVTSKSEKEIS